MYPIVDLQTPVQVKPAQGPIVAQKFQILRVVEDFKAKTVLATYEIQQADGTVVTSATDVAWAGSQYDAVVPWTDDMLIARVGQIVATKLAGA